MKLNMNTSILPLINVGLYGTNLGEFYQDIDEEYTDDFKQAICEYGKEKLEEILNEDSIKKFIGDFQIENVKFNSPMFYNYENDWLEFDFIVNINSLLSTIYYNVIDDKDFWDYIKERYCSRSGFISFFPYEKEQYIHAIKTKENLEYVVAMYVMYLIEIGQEVDLNWCQYDFEDDIQETVNRNGWIYYEED